MPSIGWKTVFSEVQRYVILLVGAALGALSVVVFLVPADIVPQGVTGVAVLLNTFVGLPIGLTVILLNIPIFYLGYRMLPGGWQMLARSGIVILVYSLFVDWLSAVLPAGGYTDDRFLNALFGGILGGISGGMVYRMGTNFGGTSTLALIIQRRTGVPLSTTFLYTDAVIVIVAGLVFGIEGALYALVVVIVSGLASDYALEGPSVIRTVFIITDMPEEVSHAVTHDLQRGVTLIPAKGMYSGQARNLLYITIMRSQVNELRDLVQNIDEKAFIVVGQGHTAYGSGFQKKRNGKPHKPAAPADQLPMI